MLNPSPLISRTRISGREGCKFFTYDIGINSFKIVIQKKSQKRKFRYATILFIQRSSWIMTIFYNKNLILQKKFTSLTDWKCEINAGRKNLKIKCINFCRTYKVRQCDSCTLYADVDMIYSRWMYCEIKDIDVSDMCRIEQIFLNDWFICRRDCKYANKMNVINVKSCTKISYQL